MLCTGTLLLNAQSTITGKITTEKGVAIQGASVIVKGTKTGTSSDVNGLYSIQVPNEKATLVFAGVGYETQEIKVKGKTVIDVKLKESVKSLQEVVVVGYGTAKRKDVTGSVVMLSGRVPGVSINNPQNYSGTYGGIYNKEDLNREGYDNIKENEFQKVTDHPLSTFSIDVDAASYSNVRRLINEGHLPTPGAVRIGTKIISW